MESTAVPYWPPEVPETLWNYGVMQAQQQPVFPFMGLRVEAGFQWAFAAGFIFVGFFAWKRFNEKTFDTKSFSYRVLTELDLTALRGSAAMRRAYMIYAGVLLLLYFAMTFFGKLILETVDKLPIAGAQVDTSSLDFSSPQWPLMLAFGFAGLAPLIPPLRIAETWLRSKAHRAVGIPTRIDQLARRIIDNFERRYSREDAVQAAEATAPAWVETHFGSKAVADRVGRVREELRRFKEWSEEEDPDWPDRSVRSDLRRLEREVASDAGAVLQEYDDIMQPEEAAPAGSRRAATATVGDEAGQARRKRLRNRLDAAVQRMSDLRGDLAAIIAVYAEGDREFGKIRKPQYHDLREALLETFSFMRVRSGPEMALLVSLLPVFAIYTMACALEWHPLLKPVQVTLLSVLVTSGLETLRFAAVFTLPAMAAFALRFYLLDRHSADRHPVGETPRLTTMERLGAVLLGVLVAVAALVLVALLWAAVLSPTSVHFQLLLFRGGFLMYFVTQAGTAAIVLFWALVACDQTAAGAPAARRWIGVACAIMVLVYLLFYFARWYNGLGCFVSGTPFLPGVVTERVCFRDNTAVDYLIYPVAAFLTCAVFGTMPKGAMAPGRGTPARGGWLAGGTAAAAGILLMAIFVPVPAQSGDFCPAGSTEPCTVTIGLRTDVEPFSYLVRTDGGGHYEGYLADLCYALFNGSGYTVRSVPVSVTDRFDRIAGARRPASSGPPVDLLCDPLTFRISSVDQEVRGFYSPPVFASGVTDLVRKSSRQRASAYLGYASNSTAQKVARQACLVDLLRIREAGAEPEVGECDPTMASARDVCAEAGPAPSLPPPAPSDLARYHFCPMSTHTDLIEWFCRKRADGGMNLDFHMAYFGDREIIQGKLAAYAKQEKHDCPDGAIERDPSNYTYEPYALVVSAERPELAQFVQRRVYAYFSQPGNARGLFQTHFPKQQMSPALAYLYLLNGVIDEETFAKETVKVVHPRGRWIDGLPVAPAKAEGATPAAIEPPPLPQPRPTPVSVAWPNREMAVPQGGPLEWRVDARRPLPGGPLAQSPG